MNKMQGRALLKIKKSGKRKGYIVAELIVVLAIIAVVVALLLPPVVENIRDAKISAEIADTQTAAVTLQALLSMTYANEIRNPDGKSLSFDDLVWFEPNDRDNKMLTYRAYAEMMDLAGVSFGFIDQLVVEGRVNLVSFRYRTPHGSLVEFERGQYTIIELY